MADPAGCVCAAAVAGGGSMSNLIRLLLRIVQLARCKGSLEHLPQSVAATLNLQPTGGFDVGCFDAGYLAILKCADWGKRCERCPRRQAFRELCQAYEDGARNLQVGGATCNGKADGGNRDGKGAEVAHVDADVGGAGGVFGQKRNDVQAHAVCDPAFPGVKNTQACTKHCQTKSKPFTQFSATHAAARVGKNFHSCLRASRMADACDVGTRTLSHPTRPTLRTGGAA